jgi:AraC family transcriptional regulator
MTGSVTPVTLGRPVRCVEQDGFIVMESVYEPLTVLAPHAHEFANISLVRGGSFVETLRGRSHECNPFSLIVKPPSETHSDRFGSAGARCLHIAFSRERTNDWRLLSRISDAAPLQQMASLPALILRIQQELRIADDVSGLVLEGLVFELLASIVRVGGSDRSRSQPCWLRKARDLIHEHSSERLSLRSIAHDVGVHPAHLGKTFRRHYRRSLGEYLRGVRIEAAMQLLVKAETPLANVAVAVGFYDQSHFTNAFKRYTGFTPAQFQVEMRTGNARYDPHRLGVDRC